MLIVNTFIPNPFYQKYVYIRMLIPNTLKSANWFKKIRLYQKVNVKYVYIISLLAKIPLYHILIIINTCISDYLLKKYVYIKIFIENTFISYRYNSWIRLYQIDNYWKYVYIISLFPLNPFTSYDFEKFKIRLYHTLFISKYVYIRLWKEIKKPAAP